MMADCRRYIRSEFIDVLKARCGEILGASDGWSLNVSEQDPNVVQFRYPIAITKNLHYVSPQVVLELGTHAEFVPHDRFTIRSFAAEEFPNVVVDGDVAVVALLAKRTFWEKQQFFMQNTTARRRNRSPPAIRVITMMLPCWPKGRSEPTLWRTRTC
jgi:hypothetical protein